MNSVSKSTDIMTVRQQYTHWDEVLKERIHTLIPALMKECGVEMWVVICSEYNEDPIFKAITPSLVLNASRTSCFIFSNHPEKGYEAMSLSRPNPAFAPYYKGVLAPGETLWDGLARLIHDYNPNHVAVNMSSLTAQADGLSKTHYDKIEAIAGDKLVSGEDLAVRYLETRTAKELELYPMIYDIAMRIQDEAYSSAVITPGVTTTTDVEYFIMQKINDLGLTHWFCPDVDLQRIGESDQRIAGAVIQKGDLLHTDMGLVYLGLATDSQRLAYVPKDGETEIPTDLLMGMANANRFQDIVMEQMKTGRTGNDIFTGSVEQAKAEGLTVQLYTHPIGYYGHGAGPLFGLYDSQRPIPVQGEVKLSEDTCYALELNVETYLPSWNQNVRFFVEETIGYSNGKAYFMDPAGRKQIKLVR